MAKGRQRLVNHEDQLAANVAYVRRLAGIPDDLRDEKVDEMIRASLAQNYYYDATAADVRRRLKWSK